MWLRCEDFDLGRMQIADAPPGGSEAALTNRCAVFRGFTAMWLFPTYMTCVERDKKTEKPKKGPMGKVYEAIVTSQTAMGRGKDRI